MGRPVSAETPCCARSPDAHAPDCDNAGRDWLRIDVGEQEFSVTEEDIAAERRRVVEDWLTEERLLQAVFSVGWGLVPVHIGFVRKLRAALLVEEQG